MIALQRVQFDFKMLTNNNGLFIVPTFAFPFDFRHRLTEVDVYSPVIYQYVVHLEVSLLAIFNLK